MANSEKRAASPSKAAKALTPLTDKARIARILAGLQTQYGGMSTALHYGNPFELLIAVMLSAQTTDVYVNKVTPRLFERFPTPEAMALATVEAIEGLIAGVSFFHTKAKHLILTSQILIREHGGIVPGDWHALVAMPGVGRKTANVVVATAFGQPAIAVDTHVFRVSNRLGLAAAKTPEEVEKQLQKAIPQELWAESHHWLIWHGRKICKAPTPRCETCFLTADCRYFQTTKPVPAPRRRTKAKPSLPEA
ncbi:MAG: endonuclease III [Candidatus Sericytochromatia bacterium]|nr:endonuclease III [Candidatus Sericytochromatia bacterium]